MISPLQGGYALSPLHNFLAVLGHTIPSFAPSPPQDDISQTLWDDVSRLPLGRH